MSLTQAQINDLFTTYHMYQRAKRVYQQNCSKMEETLREQNNNKGNIILMTSDRLPISVSVSSSGEGYNYSYPSVLKPEDA